MPDGPLDLTTDPDVLRKHHGFLALVGYYVATWKHPRTESWRGIKRSDLRRFCEDFGSRYTSVAAYVSECLRREDGTRADIFGVDPNPRDEDEVLRAMARRAIAALRGLCG